MVTINKNLQPTLCGLWHKDYGFIGNCDCNEQITDVRLQICNENIEGYYFIFNGEIISIDKDGICEFYPEGFCDTEINLFFELLDAQLSK